MKTRLSGRLSEPEFVLRVQEAKEQMNTMHQSVIPENDGRYVIVIFIL
jgi:hypothetical protein